MAHRHSSRPLEDGEDAQIDLAAQIDDLLTDITEVLMDDIERTIEIRKDGAVTPAKIRRGLLYVRPTVAWSMPTKINLIYGDESHELSMIDHRTVLIKGERFEEFDTHEPELERLIFGDVDA